MDADLFRIASAYAGPRQEELRRHFPRWRTTFSMTAGSFGADYVVDYYPADEQEPHYVTRFAVRRTTVLAAFDEVEHRLEDLDRQHEATRI